MSFEEIARFKRREEEEVKPQISQISQIWTRLETIPDAVFATHFLARRSVGSRSQRETLVFSRFR
jgi:hypothetical protein